ncbi:copper amine oxidase N-terminal domain-containing protein [Alkaliphilus transvaalensis]|uniref:copper amine oxidase N-terminal domain-containing protein n=1 Tax=Alkaliphilus transvaalensis TaxID=114628 RepID=UPI0006847D78|nr:copper amine oxidase N-terminal domain-containing protein [Alkaliphilus transvaalensis]
MKKFVAALLMIMLALSIVSTLSTSVNANTQVRVRVDGKLVSFPDQRPVIESGRTLVPIRFIAEELGHKVDWNGQKGEVTIQGEDKDIRLEIGNIRPLVNGQAITLDVPAKLVGGRTFVPLRFVSEALGAKVDWNSKTSVVDIYTGGEIVEEKYNTIESLNLKVEKVESFGDLFVNTRTGNNALLPFYQEVVFITKEQLPFAIGETIIYDIEAINDQRTLSVIQNTPPSAKNDTGLNFLLVNNEDKGSRYRTPYVQFTRDLGNGQRSVEYSVVGGSDRFFDDNFEKYTLDQAEYIVFNTAKSNIAIALENPWR